MAVEKKHLRLAMKLLLPIPVALIIVFALPQSNKFKYEFKKGEPWNYENLIADFDFPVYKSEENLRKEKDSILQNTEVFYRYNQEITDTNISKLRTYISQSLEEAKAKKILPEDSLLLFEQQVQERVKDIYEQGIIRPILDSEKAGSAVDRLYLLKNNVAQIYAYTDFKTALQAKKNLEEFAQNLSQGKAVKSIFPEDMNPEKLFPPNIIYDEEYTKKNTNEAIEKISPVRGRVKAGERIIYRGELINQNKFRILESLKKEYNENAASYDNTLLLFFARFVLIYAILLVFMLHLFFYNPTVFADNRKLLYFPILTVLFILLTSLIVANHINAFIVPIVVVPLVTASFYQPRTAFLHHTITILLLGFIVSNSFDFIVIQFIVGFVATIGISKLNRRSQILWTAFIVFITYTVLYLALGSIREGSIYKIDFRTLIWFAANSSLILVGYPLIYFFEKIFGFISDVTLIELSDTNRPLLKLLADKAPGTFQHSVQVANISEEAARKIGADALLIRAGGLYHDIGKINNPSFFIENQHGENPHDKIDPLKSADIIRRHVTNGVQMAKKHRLPKEIINFISTHHGNSKIAWFLYKYKEENPDVEVDEDQFRYLGNLPSTKEGAILMIVDSVEAASRSMKSYTEETINDLVENIVKHKISENLLIDAPITFAEIDQVKQVLKEKLQNIYHTRIEYPE